MSLVGKLLRAGIGSVDDLARQVMPAIMQTGDSVLIERTTNALRKMGARVPSQPAPGLLGTRNVPTSRQLGQAPKPQFGPGATPPAPQTGGAPGVRGVPSLVQNRPPAPLAEAPQPPVRYPEPARGETARQITMLKPGEGEVGSMGTRLTYRPGTQGVSGRLGSTTYGEGVELGASSAYPRAPMGSSAQEQMRLSSQLNQGGSSGELRGAPLLQTRGDNQYVAPRPAFGPGATGEILEPSPADVLFRGGRALDPSVADLVFGGSRGGGGALGRAVEGGPGGALVRSPGGAMVDELMIDPVRVREIFETSPENLTSTLRNAAGGVQTANLGALLSDPKLLAALTAAGGAAGFGIASMLSGGSRDQVGQPTAQAPVPGRPLFTEDGATPLGDGAPSVAPVTLPGPGVIDPSAAAAPIVTSGGAQRESAVREALAQADPVAAAVMRATEAMPPEKYTPQRGGIAKYYADREAYAKQAPVRKELVEMMRGMQTDRSGDLAAWAQANPTLAYEIQRRQLANPAANQQSAESVTTTTITTPMGSETAANAVGNAEAMGQAVVAPSQGAFDLVDVTRPQVQSNLQRVQDFIQRQAPRSRMYAGY
jgi:hypothetical protein